MPWMRWVLPPLPDLSGPIHVVNTTLNREPDMDYKDDFKGSLIDMKQYHE